MRAISLKVEHFRAFRHAEIELPSPGCLVIVGANNSGKSSLSSALDVAQGKSLPDMRHLGRQGDMLVAIDFEFDESERRRLFPSALATEFYGEGGGKVCRFEFRESVKDQAYLSCVRIRFPDGSMPAVAQVKHSGYGQYDVSSISTNTLIHEWDFTLQGRMTGHTNAFAAKQAGIEQLRELWEMYDKWCDSFVHVQPYRHGVGRGIGLHAGSRLDDTGSNLGEVLVGLKLNSDDAWRSLRDSIAELVPGVGAIETPSEGAQVQIAFRDPVLEKSINIDELGSGVKHLLMALVLGLTGQRSSVMVLEEPETSLHPAAQRALLGLLSTWAQDRTIVVTTHSTALIDFGDPSFTSVLVERTKGESTVKVVTDDWYKVAQGMGSRLSDILVANTILVLEGKTDLAILRTWFPRLFRNPRLAVVVAEGGEAVRGVEAFKRWLDQADMLEQRKVIFLRDRDELTTDEANRLSEMPTVRLLPAREIENFLLDSRAISRHLADAYKVDVSIESVESAIRRHADSLLESVAIRSLCREFQQPIRLMDQQLRASLVESDASIDEIIDAVLARVPEGDFLREKAGQKWTEIHERLSVNWEADWRRLIPGADVLNFLLREFANRGYGKESDGVSLAGLIDPPQEIADLLDQLDIAH